MSVPFIDILSSLFIDCGTAFISSLDGDVIMTFDGYEILVVLHTQVLL